MINTYAIFFMLKIKWFAQFLLDHFTDAVVTDWRNTSVSICWIRLLCAWLFHLSLHEVNTWYTFASWCSFYSFVTWCYSGLFNYSDCFLHPVSSVSPLSIYHLILVIRSIHVYFCIIRQRECFNACSDKKFSVKFKSP